MQQLGYLYINGEYIYVLCRRRELGVSLKIRREPKVGLMGMALHDESEYLKANPAMLQSLKDGQVIKI